MAWAEHEGERVQYIAVLHDDGAGFNYNIRLSEQKDDVIEVVMKPGMILTDEELVAVAEYFRYVRSQNDV